MTRYLDSFPEELHEDLMAENPLQDSFIITFADLAKFDATVMQVQQVEHIDTVEYEPEIAGLLTKVRQVVLAVGGGSSAFCCSYPCSSLPTRSS